MEVWLLFCISLSIIDCVMRPSTLAAAECQEPDPVSHAYRNLEAEKVTYECMDRFRQVGSGKRKCSSDIWKNGTASCTIDCGVPSEGVGATVTYNDTLEGSDATYACKTNFTTRNSENITRTCMRTGLWSGTPLKCTGAEDLARGKSTMYPAITDGNGKTCASFRTTTLTVALSSDSNIYFSVHELELDLTIYSQTELRVTVKTPSSWQLCKRLGIYDSGVYKFTCTTQLTGTDMKINVTSSNTNLARPKLCEVKVYGKQYTGECENPPIIVGARANLTSTYWNSTAVYSCVPPYRYAGGSNVITCGFDGYWTNPGIQCKEMDNVAREAADVNQDLIDDLSSTCVDTNVVELKLKTRYEVHWIVVSTLRNTSIEWGDAMSVSLMVDDNEPTKVCQQTSPAASMEGYDMTAFVCRGYPFADMVTVEAKHSLTICEIEVYGRNASQGVLQCMQTSQGHDYKGDMNYTVTGTPCIDWNETKYTIDQFADYSFKDIGRRCRAPTTTNDQPPFCFITPSKREYCPIPHCDRVCRQGDGRTYSGYVREANGAPCRSWNLVAPLEFDLNGLISDRDTPNCRNPLGSMSRPWCFVARGNASLCSIPICPTNVAVKTSLPDVSSTTEDAKATCFCWKGTYTFFEVALSHSYEHCTHEDQTLMMCYTGDTEWTYYSIGPRVSSSSLYETSSTLQVALTSSSTPEMTLTSSTLEMTLTSSTPEVTLTSSTPEASSTIRTPYQSFTNVSPVSTSFVQSSSVSTDHSQSSETYNLSASSSISLSSSDQSSVAPSNESSSSSILSISPSLTVAEQNISSSFEPSTESSLDLSSVVTVGATEALTTTATPITTTAPKQNCQCRCKRNLSTSALSEVMDERKANLTVDRRTTSAFIRQKTSATDQRQTATVSGTVCMAIVSVMFSCIFIPDIISVASFFIKCIKKWG
ncbi:uncharacterized protein LOC124126589 [Haliotis rufescens]|uniref:uncharacterized protein LOC124126589 n=1 Tax=Haliotis rufescens TaxID=6454 RepID=UPI00201FAC1A|nr:uncharacterized protein LOC124126589 [Haliotis rufescens]XP_048253812.1 uncharacterized protein LOC124126589 [Haliotis rufescens]